MQFPNQQTTNHHPNGMDCGFQADRDKHDEDERVPVSCPRATSQDASISDRVPWVRQLSQHRDGTSRALASGGSCLSPENASLTRSNRVPAKTSPDDTQEPS